MNQVITFTGEDVKRCALSILRGIENPNTHFLVNGEIVSDDDVQLIVESESRLERYL